MFPFGAFLSFFIIIIDWLLMSHNWSLFFMFDFKLILLFVFLIKGKIGIYLIVFLLDSAAVSKVYIYNHILKVIKLTKMLKL